MRNVEEGEYIKNRRSLLIFLALLYLTLVMLT